MAADVTVSLDGGGGGAPLTCCIITRVEATLRANAGDHQSSLRKGKKKIQMQFPRCLLLRSPSSQRRPHTASSWARCPDWHPARPALPHWTGKALALSLPTLRIPSTSFHRDACGPSPSPTIHIHTQLRSAHFKPMPSNQREENDATNRCYRSNNKKKTHLNVWLLCNHTQEGMRGEKRAKKSVICEQR